MLNRKLGSSLILCIMSSQNLFRRSKSFSFSSCVKLEYLLPNMTCANHASTPQTNRRKRYSRAMDERTRNMAKRRAHTPRPKRQRASIARNQVTTRDTVDSNQVTNQINITIKAKKILMHFLFP